jgi:hypothetical protein
VVWLENYLSRDDARPDHPRAGFFMGQAMWFALGFAAGFICGFFGLWYLFYELG